MAGHRPHEQRRFPRVDVRHRVHGELIDIDGPILVHDMSHSGFGVFSRIAFEPGRLLDFRISGPGTTFFSITAEAVHTRAILDAPGWHFSGFKFVPGRLLPTVPYALIDQLMAAVGYDEPPVKFVEHSMA